MTNELDASTYSKLFKKDVGDVKGVGYRDAQIQKVSDLAKEHLLGKYIGQFLISGGEKLKLADIVPAPDENSLHFELQNEDGSHSTLGFNLDIETGHFYNTLLNPPTFDKRSANIIANAVKDYTGNKNFSVHDLKAKIEYYDDKFYQSKDL